MLFGYEMPKYSIKQRVRAQKLMTLCITLTKAGFAAGSASFASACAAIIAAAF